MYQMFKQRDLLKTLGIRVVKLNYKTGLLSPFVALYNRLARFYPAVLGFDVTSTI